MFICNRCEVCGTYIPDTEKRCEVCKTESAKQRFSDSQGFWFGVKNAVNESDTDKLRTEIDRCIKNRDSADKVLTAEFWDNRVRALEFALSVIEGRDE